MTLTQSKINQNNPLQIQLNEDILSTKYSTLYPSVKLKVPAQMEYHSRLSTTSPPTESSFYVISTILSGKTTSSLTAGETVQ